MDINTGQRTYFISASGTTTTSQVLAIPFEDTTGNIIRCNYFKLTGAASPATAILAVVAEPSGLSRVGDMVTNQLSALKDFTALNGSGILGIGGVTCGGTLQEVWHGANGEVCNGVKLHIVSSGTWAIGITYGNLLPYNPVRGMPVTNAVGNGTYSAGNGSYDKGI
jgi:hypothetical protein